MVSRKTLLFAGKLHNHVPFQHLHGNFDKFFRLDFEKSVRRESALIGEL